MPEAVLTTCPNVAKYLEFAQSQLDADVVEEAAKCARIASSHSMKMTQVRQSTSACIMPEISVTPFKIASSYDCAYVWHRFPFESDTDLCFCKATGVEKFVIKSMMMSVERMYHGDSRRSNSRTS